MKKIKDLTVDLMKDYPVWKWGDSMEYLEPIKDYDPLPNDVHPMFIFVKLNFGNADKSIDGYLVGSEITYHAIGVFLDDEEYVINFRLLDDAHSTIDKISKHLGVRDFNLFLIKYRAAVYELDGELLEGEIEIN